MSTFVIFVTFVVKRSALSANSALFFSGRQA
jgi:hypothetical protein